ncbi:MAG TPA: energy-coupling factor ABC transporter permease [Wenzhouxiangellaceae bacterium]|nr:energy-coupling factor ABC transporter permease [Wenzhouxiangellaceae bacterium]
MHIPDGLIAPQAYLAAAAIAVPCWAYAVKRVSSALDERAIPRLAVLTALAFVLSTIMLPLPGGTSAHLYGMGLLVLVFGLWPAFLAFSLVLALQALLLGAGGITALPVNALTMGLAGGAVVVGARSLLGANTAAWATVFPVWLGVVVAATGLALVLGAQPLLGSDTDGQPLFFPFGPAVTLPVIVLPHMVIGLLEGILTWMVLGVLQARRAAA